MQGFPQAAPPMGAGSTPPVAGVNHISGVPAPGGVTPSITQAPTYVPQAGAPFGPPSIMPTPGPATLGPATSQGTGAGGVPGVSMAPMAGVLPPAAPGGPHPLPGMPGLPLPQGFPNPFQVGQIGGQTHPGMGQQTVTGPQGYMPGIGYFGTPPQGGRQGIPGPANGPLPGIGMPPPGFNPAPGMSAPMGGAQALPGVPVGPPQSVQGAPPPRVPTNAAPPAAQGAGPAQSAGPGLSPFWLQLAWQLLQTPQTRQALGDHSGKLAEPANLSRTIEAAAGCLQAPEMQAAFRELTEGKLDQNKFLDRFAASAQQALRRAGLL